MNAFVRTHLPFQKLTLLNNIHPGIQSKGAPGDRAPVDKVYKSTVQL